MKYHKYDEKIMCKHIAQIIHFPSILSLVFVFSYAKLKETNEETGLFSTFTQRKLVCLVYNTQVPRKLKNDKFAPPPWI